MKRQIEFVFCAILSFSVHSVQVQANSQDQFSVRYDLDGFFEIAKKQGFQLQISQAKVQSAQQKYQEARSYSMPSGQLSALVAPVPGSQGDGLSGETLMNQWGPLYQLNLEILQPLYTFGVLGSARNAAREGWEAEKALGQGAEWKLRTELAELFYGYQLAFEFENFANDIAKLLERAVDEGQKLRRQKHRRAPSEHELEKIQVFIFEAKARHVEAQKAKEQVSMAMAWKLGWPLDQRPLWSFSNLRRRHIDAREFNELLVLMREHRPELRALRGNFKAKQALLDMESSHRWPKFFAGIRSQHSWAAHRENQTNPFLYDPFNEHVLVAGVGLRMDLDFFTRSARIARSRAEWLEAQAMQDHWSLGIEAELRKNYLENLKFAEVLDHSEQAMRLAHRIVQDSMVQFALGAQEARSLLESLTLQVNARKNYLENLFKYNMSLIHLEASLGLTL